MNRQRNSFDKDSRLSDAYRELQDEHAPRHLDEEIMNMAAREARTPYGALRAWTRPVAWAAMIGLCLTVVLELTRIDNDAALPPTESRLQEPVPAPRAMPASAPAALDAAGSEKSLLKQRRISGKAEPAMATLPAPVAEQDLTTVAAEQTQQAAVPGETQGGNACDAAARETPESWYDCIRRLWDTGQDDAAEIELQALREFFPDFSAPARHK